MNDHLWSVAELREEVIKLEQEVERWKNNTLSMENHLINIRQSLGDKDKSEIISLPNDIRSLKECNEDLTAKLQYLLSNFIISEEGLFCFPDGDTWDCKKDEPHS